MPQRLQQPRPDPRRARRPQRARGLWGARTIPGEIARDEIARDEAGRDEAAEEQPTLLGFPAEFRDEDETEGAVEPEDFFPSDGELVVVRRADRIGGGALVLAGVAANVSLALSWGPGDGPSGLSQVERGVQVLGSGVPGSVPLSTWQPLVVVLSGGLLVLLGFLLLIPARAHRLVGVLALVVSLAAASAVVILMADTGWWPDRSGPGMWCALAVPVLGLMGSLKAMLTAPLVIFGHR